ncbi:cell envelope integrity protein CreD [Sanyastnella coralliicola]|uniref:cell envelope integrity protein CreD n=1 Tax=Sanyastnella coralliicola TaxID=3069118 RepID=UPI0027BA47BD|nr:cell envelope integrity protein CreD [Longitalea sp. SCSIO 12813]
MKTSRMLFKVLTVILLVIILLFPALLVQNLVNEREMLQQSARNEVSSQWGAQQTISGPFITIPCDKILQRTKMGDGRINVKKERFYLHIMPEELNMTGDIDPQQRNRGIYEAVVYSSKINIDGFFTAPNLGQVDTANTEIHYDQAVLNVGLSDLKGIDEQIELQWNKNTSRFEQGVRTQQIVNSGLQAAVNFDKAIAEQHFSFQLDLKGSERLFFVPVGKTSQLTLNSPWADPGFTGNFLPDERQVSDDGFTAKWKILHLNRHFPQQWKGGEFNFYGSSFGVDLLMPVDNYTKAHRVTRYAILFIACTFLVFFFVEVIKGIHVHPIQYLLVGISLVVFYVLLLSLSEYVLFNIAYIVSALMTLILIAFYTRAVLKSLRLAALTTGVLVVLYGFIFTIIQMEHYSLLIGSLGVFTVLAVVMGLSRGIDWYELSASPPESKQEEREQV